MAGTWFPWNAECRPRRVTQTSARRLSVSTHTIARQNLASNPNKNRLYFKEKTAATRLNSVKLGKTRYEPVKVKVKFAIVLSLRVSFFSFFPFLFSLRVVGEWNRQKINFIRKKSSCNPIKLGKTRYEPVQQSLFPNFAKKTGIDFIFFQE